MSRGGEYFANSLTKHTQMRQIEMKLLANEKDTIGSIVELEAKETSEIIRKVKSGKATGLDDKPIEVWKCMGQGRIQQLTRVINKKFEIRKNARFVEN